MDMNAYLVEWLAREHQLEIQTAVGREQLAGSLGRKLSLRVSLGSALVYLGQRLQGDRAGAATQGARVTAAV